MNLLGLKLGLGMGLGQQLVLGLSIGLKVRGVRIRIALGLCCCGDELIGNPFECLELETSFLVCMYIFVTSVGSLNVKVVRSRSRSYTQ